MSALKLTNKIETCIVETLNSHRRKTPKEEGTFLEWDGLMKKIWESLINPPLMYKKGIKMRETSVDRFLPLVGGPN